ncbi:MAG: PocR ligand-binding domain-containing protein [Anaerolineae bacterium]|nr:PocR ligand-binding domain-containing protein [Anaerolineae bacterium]
MADLLTTQDVQALLHVDRTTIYRMVESGQLPAMRVGKQWRFARAEIEQWLENARMAVRQSPGQQKAVSAVAPAASALEPFPVACLQLIQDAFADLLGVMIIVTDMEGRPITRFSNPCGFYLALIRDPQMMNHCIWGWQQLAADPAIEPKFMPSEMGLLCARGLIRVGTELKGMVVIGGVAPDVWPPTAEQLEHLAARFGVSVAEVAEHIEEVYRLDKAAQERALRFALRIADIFSHIVSDRNALCGRLQAIASLTAL